MKETIPLRITMHVRPAVKRLTVTWIAAIVIMATGTVGMTYHAHQIVAACWVALAVLFIYAMSVLRKLRGVKISRRQP